MVEEVEEVVVEEWEPLYQITRPLVHVKMCCVTMETCIPVRRRHLVLQRGRGQWTASILHCYPKSFTILTFSHSYTHSHTDSGVDHARQPAGQEQSG